MRVVKRQAVKPSKTSETEKIGKTCAQAMSDWRFIKFEVRLSVKFIDKPS